MGETLPFMLPRIDRGLPKEITKLERSVGDYLTQNVNYTFSGFNYTQNFLDSVSTSGSRKNNVFSRLSIQLDDRSQTFPR